MFGSSYWAYPEVDGVRACYAKAPTFICPLASAAEYVKPEDAETGAWEPRAPGLEAAAAALELPPADLGKLLVHAHQRRGAERRRVDGRLTNLCATCGHRLERLGFRVWLQVTVPAGEATESERMSAVIVERLGGDAFVRRTERVHYLETKREAAAWARDEYRTRKAASEEG